MIQERIRQSNAKQDRKTAALQKNAAAWNVV